MSGRNWISFSLGRGIRIGRSICDPQLPSWKRFELRHTLQEAAKARSETLTIDDCNYLIDKALVLGLLDHNGNGDLSEFMSGTRDEIIAAMIAAGVGGGERRMHVGILAIIAVVAVVLAFAWQKERGITVSPGKEDYHTKSGLPLPECGSHFCAE